MSTEFPFIGSSATENMTDDLPLFREYAWDFEQDKFRYDGNGNHILLTGNDALEVWICKALKTERFDYLAYSWQYGIELKPFIGKVMSVQERYSELKRSCTECLMVNPYIKSIDSFTIEQQKNGETAQLTIELTTVYGEMSISV
ncbi:DUF2634 domain-containing protein [uncultured Mitsuokella sp.]|uniref:DUF2634 domain-containing protein n=2 Tax=Mitsuokella TaxID=52225 RepID=UPI0025923014|nr:DUF2634 domain-containing protein [uncultured Mitsuokella sp.]